MPEIQPFRAWRYAGSHLDITSLIAPPYDVIASLAEEGLRGRDPHNVVRLILPHDAPGRPESRYGAARVELEAWAASGVLAQDPSPAFYPYRQTYRVEGRREAARVGFLGLLKLQPFGAEVMAHEHTLSGPREDRFKLLSAVRANLSPVFVLFKDEGGEVTHILEQAMRAPTDARANREQGEHDELWRLAEPGRCAALRSALALQPLVFADGHHRYESALRHLEGLKAQGEDPGSAAYTLAYFAPVPQAGMSILPTHRILHGLPEDRVAELPLALESRCAVREAGSWKKESDVREWEAQAAALAGSGLALALARDSRLLEVTLPPGAEEAALGALEPTLRELDVNFLHEVILKGMLGIGEQELASQSAVRYAHESLGALDELYGDAQAVFLLRPMPIDSVFRVAGAGLRMPQKSTFFYPKVTTGFVIHRHAKMP